MNNAEAAGNRLIVILNDNDMSIAPPVGALEQLARPAGVVEQISDPAARSPRSSRARCRTRSTAGRGGSRNIPAASGPAAPCSRSWASIMSARSTAMMSRRWSRSSRMSATPTIGPMLVHVVTKKGKGYAPAEAAADKYHGVVKFDVVSGKQDKGPGGGPPSYTAVFAKALVGGAGARREGRRDHRGDAVGHRARQVRRSASPTATFDVGIAEQHAVTFAGGLGGAGHRPFCAIYSTFLQRAYDQVVHDVAIQNLPVRFAMDRAGLVGADGATHCRRVRPRLSVHLAQFHRDGGGRRGRARPHGPHHGGARHGPDRGALSARRGARAGASGRAAGARDRQGPDRPRGQDGRDPVARHPARGSARRPPTSWRRWGCRRRSPTCASPSRSTTS